MSFERKPRTSGTPGTFAEFQPRYAEHGIAALPVDAIKKKPLITEPQRLQIADSARLARQFHNAGVGFWAGARNRITVLDVDDASETEMADAMLRYGQSPLVVRTPSGGFHAYYRHGGEGRAVRVENKPWDILGSGLVIAPPTATKTSGYRIIQGSLDDLDRLPAMREGRTPRGRRNKELWAHCMKHALHCDCLNDLLDVARTFNTESCVSPLPDTEVVRTARSAWEYTERGLNRFGKHGAYLTTDEVDRLFNVGGMNAVALATLLRAHNVPNSTFLIANGWHKKLGWGRETLAAARRHVASAGIIQRAGRAPYYRFQTAEKSAAILKDTTSPLSPQRR